MSPERTALLGRLPDLPRWVELRSVLLAGRGEILGFRPEPLAAAVADPAFGSAIVVGHPSFAAIGESLAAAGPSGTLMCPSESVEWVRLALPELTVERAVLHELGGAPALPPVCAGEARQLGPEEIDSLALPRELADELRAAAARTPVAAALAEGRPVAFCYAGSVTESLWDVSIETLEPWRRRGYAARAVAFEIERFQALGKRPVWGAVESNEPSWRLARKLGFVPVDALWISATPPSNPPA